MPKRRRSKAFWKNFKFKYKLTIVNENTLEEIVGLRVSKLNGLSVLLCVLAVLFLIASCIITFTPLRNYLPGYMNSEVRTQIVDNALRVDSLQQVLNKQNLYIMNIQDIFSGKVSIDSVQTLDSLTTAREDTLMERTKREEEFRRQYEENEKYNLTSITSQPDVTGLIYTVDTRYGVRPLQCREETLRHRHRRQSQRKRIGNHGRNRHPKHIHRRDRLSDWRTT